MIEEIWKPIKNYEGFYEVSNLGRIRSLTREVIDKKKNRVYTVLGHIKKASDNGRGYKTVMLSKDGKQKRIYIHRLVATLFLDNPNNYEEVNHKDGNKSNNVVDNLEWCTAVYNIRHAMNVLNFKPGELNKTKIFCVEEQKWYNSISEFFKSKNVKGSSVSGVLDCPNKSIGGFHITSKEINYDKTKYTSRGSKWIKCIENEMFFPNKKSAAEYFGVCIGSIKTVINKRTCCAGYHWEKANNDKMTDFNKKLLKIY